MGSVESTEKNGSSGGSASGGSSSSEIRDTLFTSTKVNSADIRDFPSSSSGVVPPLGSTLFNQIIGLGSTPSSSPGVIRTGDNYIVSSEPVNHSTSMAVAGPSSILGVSSGLMNFAGSGATTTTVGFMESSESPYNSTNELLDRGGVGGGGTRSSDFANLAADDLFLDYDLALTQLAAVFCVIFIVVGVPGNLITIIALARCKKVRNATAYFIINLSACDLMFCCFNLPLATSMFWNRRWIHGDTLCRLFPLFRYGLMAVSIFTVLAITINRYVMIGHPRVYPRLYRTRYLGVMIMLIWLGSFGALVPTLLGVWGKFELDKEIGSCSIMPGENNRSPKEFLFVIAFVLPCCAIIVCYARIFCIVRNATANLRPMEVPSSAGNVNHSLETESLSPDQAVILRRTSARPSIAVIHQKGKMTNKDRKLLWMILVIFGAFVVCYLPITIFKTFKHKHSTWNIFGYLLIYMTTCINPLVYVLMSSDYRQAYTNLFLCRKDWNLSSRTSNSNKT